MSYITKFPKTSPRSVLFIVACFFLLTQKPLCSAPVCATLTAKMDADVITLGGPVVADLTLTSKLPETVLIYEEIAVWAYTWNVEDASGQPLKLTKLGEHYADKSPHRQAGNRPTKWIPGGGVPGQIDLNEVVVFPAPGDYQVRFSRIVALPGNKTCSVAADPLRFHIDAGK